VSAERFRQGQSVRVNPSDFDDPSAVAFQGMQGEFRGYRTTQAGEEHGIVRFADRPSLEHFRVQDLEGVRS
jgi:hypothetical protein